MGVVKVTINGAAFTDLREAQEVRAAIAARLRECGLELHPEKTKVVYCKDEDRRRTYPNEKFDSHSSRAADEATTKFVFSGSKQMWSWFYMKVCGPLARTWLFDIYRGTSKSSFTEGKVYLDGTGAVCFCKRLIQSPGQDPSALILRMIDIPTMGQTIVLETPVALNVSGLYLEVKEERQAAQMRWKLEYHMRRGERLRPETLGVQIASGAEGSHTTALLRMPVQPDAAAKKSEPSK